MTELRAALAERLEAARELALLIDAMPGALQRLRPDENGHWQAVFTSRSLATLLGTDDPETAAATLRDGLVPADADMLLACQNAALADGEAACEVEFRPPGLEPRILRAALRFNPRGDHCPELIAVWTDITEDRLRRARLAHADRLSTLGEMAAGLAHELNQPLAAIMVLADVVTIMVGQGTTPPPDIIDKIDRIAAMAERAGKIIQNLRNFARHAAGSNGPVSLPQAIDNTRAMIGRMIEADGIAIHTHLPPGLPHVLGEMTQIEQVLVNLLLNARDALVAARRRDARIDITAVHESDTVRVDIADNGGGIDPAIHDRLFDPFFTTKGSSNGTGLGLSIARNAMTAMNGHIALRNASGGAVFTLEFKSAAADTTPDTVTIAL